jgi:hypothetical protein
MICAALVSFGRVAACAAARRVGPLAQLARARDARAQQRLGRALERIHCLAGLDLRHRAVLGLGVCPRVREQAPHRQVEEHGRAPRAAVVDRLARRLVRIRDVQSVAAHVVQARALRERVRDPPRGRLH